MLPKEQKDTLSTTPKATPTKTDVDNKFAKMVRQQWGEAKETSNAAVLCPDRGDQTYLTQYRTLSQANWLQKLHQALLSDIRRKKLNGRFPKDIFASRILFTIFHNKPTHREDVCQNVACIFFLATQRTAKKVLRWHPLDHSSMYQDHDTDEKTQTRLIKEYIDQLFARVNYPLSHQERELREHIDTITSNHINQYDV